MNDVSNPVKAPARPPPSYQSTWSARCSYLPSYYEGDVDLDAYRDFRPPTREEHLLDRQDAPILARPSRPDPTILPSNPTVTIVSAMKPVQAKPRRSRWCRTWLMVLALVAVLALAARLIAWKVPKAKIPINGPSSMANTTWATTPAANPSQHNHETEQYKNTVPVVAGVTTITPAAFTVTQTLE